MGNILSNAEVYSQAKKLENIKSSKLHSYFNQMNLMKSIERKPQNPFGHIQNNRILLQNNITENSKFHLLKNTNLNKLNILDLPVELLVHINKFLNLSDQIILADVHVRFYQIFQICLRSSKMLTTEICDQRISDNLINKIIYDNRQFIQMFRICPTDSLFNWNDVDRAITLVLYEATHLRTLYLDFRYHLEHEEFFTQYSFTLQNLQNLTIRNSVISDARLEELASIRSIKYLDITNNDIIEGGCYFGKFKNLETLILNKCSNFKPHVLGYITQNCKKLRTLDIRIHSFDIYLMSDAKYKYVFRNLKKLENLAVIDLFIIKRQNISIILNNLLNLKSLIYSIYSTTDNPHRHKMKTFLNAMAKNLIKLKLDFRFYESVDVHMNEYLVKMVNLQNLHVTGVEYCHENFDWFKLIDFNSKLETLNVNVYRDEFVYQNEIKHNFFDFIIAKRNRNFNNLIIKILDFNMTFFIDMLAFINAAKRTYTHNIIIECSLKQYDLKAVQMHPVYVEAKHLINFVSQKYDCYWACDEYVTFDGFW